LAADFDEAPGGSGLFVYTPQEMFPPYTVFVMEKATGTEVWHSTDLEPGSVLLDHLRDRALAAPWGDGASSDAAESVDTIP
jgi:hypothetical protein